MALGTLVVDGMKLKIMQQQVQEENLFGLLLR